MYKNNNSHIIYKIVGRSLRYNKLRNLFAIIGIILTTVLLSGVITIGSSLLNTIERNTMRQVGTISHGGFKYLNESQFEILKSHESIVAYSKSISVGVLNNQAMGSYRGEIHYKDLQGIKWGMNVPFEGKIPKGGKEILLTPWLLELFGIEPVIGKSIALEFTVGDRCVKDTFVVSGFYNGDKNVTTATQLFVSEEYVKGLEERLLLNKEHNIQIDKKANSNLGPIQLAIMFKDTQNIQSKLNKLYEESGIKLDDLERRIAVNWAYFNPSLNLEVLLPVIVFLLLIMASGYLLIYNIFYISIVKDIRFYGLLKSVGMTGKQLQKLVLFQSLMLSCIAIPVGVIIGYIVGDMLMPLMVQGTTLERDLIGAKSSVVIIQVAFALLTVLLSCRKPAKIAGKVSPKEALNYDGNTGNLQVKRKSRAKAMKAVMHKRRHGAKIYRMSLANVLRNKKKFSIVILSICSSVMLSLLVFQGINNFSIGKYVERFIQRDVMIAESSVFNRTTNSSDNSLTMVQYEELKHLKGLKTIEAVYVTHGMTKIETGKVDKFITKEKEAGKDFDKKYETNLNLLDNQSIATQLYGYSETMIKELVNNLGRDGNLDMDLLKSGEYAIVCQDRDANFYNVGDNIQVVVQGQQKTFKIMALVDYNYASDLKYFTPYGNRIYLPLSVYDKWLPEKRVLQVLINAREGMVDEVNAQVEAYIKSSKGLSFRSKADYISDYEDFIKMLRLIGYVLSGVIGFVALLNLMNTLLTSIIVRKREFAMLESMGMTKKQLLKMLISEGVWYGGVSVVILATLGQIIIKGLITSMAAETFFLLYQPQPLINFIVFTMIMLVCGMIPWVCYMTTSKETIVERLRTID